MFEYIKRKYQEWQRERRWMPTDICSYKSMTIYMCALNPNETLNNPMLLNKEDGVSGGEVTIDTSELARTIGEEKAIQRAMAFIEFLEPQFNAHHLLYAPVYTDKENPKVIHLPLTNRRYTTREKTLNRMKRVIYPHLTQAEQNEVGKWDEKRADYEDEYRANLFKEYRNKVPKDALDDIVESKTQLAMRIYDRNHPGDGKAR